MSSYLEGKIKELEDAGKTPAEIHDELAMMHATNPTFEALMTAVKTRYDVAQRTKAAAKPQPSGAPGVERILVPPVPH